MRTPTPRTLAALAVVATIATACADDTDGGAPVALPSEEVTPAPDPEPTSPEPTTTPVEVPAPATPSPEATSGVLSPTGPVAVDVLAEREDPVRFVVPWATPTSAAELAAVLREAELAVRDPGLDDDVRAVAAHRAQRMYRQLGREPGWEQEVLAALPEELRFAAEKNLAARAALDSLRGSAPPPETLPAWEIVEPEPADALLSYYREAGDALGVDWTILAGINLVETRMGRIVGFSTAMARGPMQFIPASWEAFGAGGDIDDARDSIFAAARHLSERPGDPPSDRGALFNYNNHDAYGEAVLAYADVLRANPEAYAGYHGWQVYYTVPEAGDLLLPIGYREEEPVPISDYLDRPTVEVVR